MQAFEPFQATAAEAARLVDHGDAAEMEERHGRGAIVEEQLSRKSTSPTGHFALPRQILVMRKWEPPNRGSRSQAVGQLMTNALGTANGMPAKGIRIVIRFGLAAPEEICHVPLLLSPCGSSTDRGC